MRSRKEGFAGGNYAPFGQGSGWFGAQRRARACNQDQVRLTLTATGFPQGGVLDLHLEGQGRIQQRDVTRPAIPAEDMMQAFAYRHLVPMNELKLAVLGRGTTRAPLRLLSALPIQLPAAAGRGCSSVWLVAG